MQIMFICRFICKSCYYLIYIFNIKLSLSLSPTSCFFNDCSLITSVYVLALGSGVFPPEEKRERKTPELTLNGITIKIGQAVNVQCIIVMRSLFTIAANNNKMMIIIIIIIIIMN